MVLALCEMQKALYLIWAEVAVSISYDSDHYIINMVKKYDWKMKINLLN